MIYLQFLTIYTQTNPLVVFSVTLFAMLPQVAHGLELGNTVDKNSTVREALKDTYTSIEEGKADIIEGGNFEFEKDWYKCKKCFK